MGWSILRGAPAWLKIFSLIWGSVCFALIIRNHAKLYEPLASLKSSSFDLDKNRTKHVIEDEICVSIVGVILFGSLIWLFVILLDLVKDTKRRKWIDMGLHMGAGVLLLLATGLFSYTVFQRRVDFIKLRAGENKTSGEMAKKFLKYGYFNIIFYNFDPFYLAPSSIFSVALFPHRHDHKRFIECIFTAICVFLNGVLYIFIAVVLFLKKWARVIKAPKNTILYYTPCLFRKRTGILRLVTIILGFLTVILIATSFAEPQVYHYRPYKRVLFETTHNVQEEFVLAMVTIYFLLSGAWLTVFLKKYIPEGSDRRKMDRWFHITGGIFLMITSAIWFVSISLRTYTYTTWMHESHPLADARTRAGFRNIILLRVTMKRRALIELFEHKYDDEKFAHVIIAGSLILINGGVYMYLGLLLLWIKYGRLRDIRWIHPSPELEAQHVPELQEPPPQEQQPEQQEKPQEKEPQKTEKEEVPATKENGIPKEAETV